MSDQNQKTFSVGDYDLAATLSSGQAFRWQPHQNGWIGVIDGKWVRLHSAENKLTAQTATVVSHWDWLTDYLQTDLDLVSVLSSFPDDDAMRGAVHACHGLRLLRQNYWECLASFILSSTKQIVQIRQIISLLCERYGDSVVVPAGHSAAYSFPTPERLARVSEAELRDCRMGFRAPYLLAAARASASGNLRLAELQEMGVGEARAELIKLPGVGPKIADCVLLFAYGFQTAFPVDVWVMRALRQLYFPKRRPSAQRLQRFTKSYFGPYAGYAQQYLFHYMRTHQVAEEVG